MTTATKTTTEKQQRIFEFIRDFRDENGYCVSLQELCDAFGYASKNSVMCHLNALRRQGLITWNENESRTLRPTMEPAS